MTGKKRGIKTNTSYYIGHEKNNFDENAPHLVSKLKQSSLTRSNFWGTQFNVFDMGKNPSKAKNVNEIRSEWAVVNYVAYDDSRRRTSSE